jgi:hypothetical protein
VKEADGVVAEIRKGGGRADAIAMDLAAADRAGKLARQPRSIIGDRLDVIPKGLNRPPSNASGSGQAEHLHEVFDLFSGTRSVGI